MMARTGLVQPGLSHPLAVVTVTVSLVLGSKEAARQSNPGQAMPITQSAGAEGSSCLPATATSMGPKWASGLCLRASMPSSSAGSLPHMGPVPLQGVLPMLALRSPTHSQPEWCSLTQSSGHQLPAEFAWPP